MTGPEFYKAAAQDLNDAEARIPDCTQGETAIALAVIGVGRAVLALAAATADPYGHETRWAEATR